MVSPSALCEHNCFHTVVTEVNAPKHQINKITHVVLGDQNIVKGFLWGFAAFKVGTLTLGAATLTAGLAASILIIPPFTLVPITAAMGTVWLAQVTGNCIDNAAYHLGPRKFVVIS